MRTLNFVDASNSDIDAKMDAMYPKTYSPFVNPMPSGITCADLAASGTVICLRALTAVQVSTEPRTRMVRIRKSSGALNSSRRQASIGRRKVEMLYSAVSKFAAVIGCQTSVRFVPFPATTSFRIAHPIAHGRKPARKMPARMARLRHV